MAWASNTVEYNVVNSQQDFDPIDKFLWANLPFSVQYNGGPRFALGQPVACGERGATALGALRMCVSAPWAVDSWVTPAGTQRAIELAMQAFDAVAGLAGWPGQSIREARASVGVDR